MPINITILWPEDGMRYNQTRAIAWIVIDEENYFRKVNDTSDVIYGVLILMCIFLTVISIILIVVWICFLSYSLRPIKILNRKIKVLLQNNLKFDLASNQLNINSPDVRHLYESCSKLIITRRFAKNDIDTNDALAIMDYANAFEVFEENEQVRGIWLTNI